VNNKGLVTAASNISTTDDACVTGNTSTANVINDSSKVWWLTVNSNATLTISVAADPTYAKSLTVALVGDGTHTANFVANGGTIAWDMGSSLPMNTVAGKTSVFTFLRLPGTTKWFAGRAVYEG